METDSVFNAFMPRPCSSAAKRKSFPPPRVGWLAGWLEGRCQHRQLCNTSHRICCSCGSSVLYLTLIVFGSIWFSLSHLCALLPLQPFSIDKFKFYWRKTFYFLYEFGNCLQWQSDWYLHWCAQIYFDGVRKKTDVCLNSESQWTFSQMESIILCRWRATLGSRFITNPT